MQYEIWKVRKKIAKGGFELGSIASKNMCLTIYATATDDWCVFFVSVDYLNHTLVDGVSVNSLCQQGGLFALSVNIHSVTFMANFVAKYISPVLWKNLDEYLTTVSGNLFTDSVIHTVPVSNQCPGSSKHHRLHVVFLSVSQRQPPQPQSGTCQQ